MSEILKRIRKIYESFTSRIKNWITLKQIRPVKFFFIFFLAVSVCVFLQLSFPNYISVFRVAPDILLVINIIFALNLNKRDALIIGFFLGSIKDALSCAVFGVNTILFVAWVLIIDMLSRSLYKESIETVLLISLVSIATIIEAFVMRFWFIARGTVVGNRIFLTRMVLGTVYNALIAFAVFRFFKKCVLKYYR